MFKFAIRNQLGDKARAPLWGDRARWGLTIDENDPGWREWERTYLDFYTANQRAGIGLKVNDAGYRVMSRIDLAGRRVVEIGAGDIRHLALWNARPAEYVLVDVQADMLGKAEAKLREARVPYRSLVSRRGEPLPIEDASMDVAISFFSLEHIRPLDSYLAEVERVLRPGGLLVGAIPMEGGLAWGLGRMLTSRRWFKKNTTIDPDKIICWEHPNFAEEVISALDLRFERRLLTCWPVPWLPLQDINLVVRMIYRKKA